MSESGESGFVGFANLPNQVHRKSVKRGFEFTLMVVGESGLGKSTLVNSLFLTDLYAEREYPPAADRIKQTVQLETSTVEIEERGVRLRLTVVDTPGFGDAVNNKESWKPLIKYINMQYENYLRDESGLNRRNIIDNRVHCCLYFISPTGHGLKPLDIEFMKQLHDKVNVIPVIAKADTLTPSEVKTLKKRVMNEIKEHKVRIYMGETEDEEETAGLKESIPFAVVGSNTLLEVGGKKVRGRLYPWGVVEVENSDHCDFTKLRNMLIRTHMQDLKDVTQDVHYENFRLHRLRKASGTREQEATLSPDGMSESDRKLAEKEAELEKMRQMMAMMQQQLQQQQQV
ncbi:septin-1-like isoform X2 [Corticium candelabrum]|uniref:septin-1-like isoform X2 n=1 Tax=Corticium candelabrum TaxID=121492 RepID=UPI002E26D31D|nr:septin-1-like isoform X2 [Corticium candelabrum]